MKEQIKIIVIYLVSFILIIYFPFMILKLVSKVDSPHNFNTVKCIGTCKYQIQFIHNEYGFYIEDGLTIKVKKILKYKDDKQNKKLYIISDEEYKYCIFDYEKEEFNYYQNIEELNANDLKIFKNEKGFTELKEW